MTGRLTLTPRWVLSFTAVFTFSTGCRPESPNHKRAANSDTAAAAAAELAERKVTGLGADAVTCTDAAGAATVEVLDIYETRNLRNRQVSMGDPALTFQDKIEIALDRLDNLDIDQAEIYRQAARAFMEQAAFLPGVELEDVPDTGEVMLLPANCKMQQLVVQTEPRFPSDTVFVVAKDLWDLLDEDSKAGVVLHEVIYREAHKLGHEDSYAVRYFLSLLTSNYLATTSVKNYIAEIRATNLPGGTVKEGPFTFWLEPIENHENGNIRKAVTRFPAITTVNHHEVGVRAGSEIEFHDNQVLSKAFLCFDTPGNPSPGCAVSDAPRLRIGNDCYVTAPDRGKGYAEFFANGLPQTLSWPLEFNEMVEVCVRTASQRNLAAKDFVTPLHRSRKLNFYDTGVVTEIEGYPRRSIEAFHVIEGFLNQCKYDGYRAIRVNNGTPISFYPSGMISRVEVFGKHFCYDRHMTEITINGVESMTNPARIPAIIYFRPDGIVERFGPS